MALKQTIRHPTLDFLIRMARRSRFQIFVEARSFSSSIPRLGPLAETFQAVSLRDAGKHLDQLKVAVVGVSPDSPATQKKFAEKSNLNFLSLSDLDHKVSKSYGAWGQKTMYGKKFEGSSAPLF